VLESEIANRQKIFEQKYYAYLIYSAHPAAFFKKQVNALFGRKK